MAKDKDARITPVSASATQKVTSTQPQATDTQRQSDRHTV